jgi:heat shock protein beta
MKVHISLSLLIFMKLRIYVAQDFSGNKPLSWSHFTAEGDVEFKAVLYVAPKAPQDLYESYYNSNNSNLKLYVRRVFISDEFDELLPKYLSFLIVS